MKFSLVMATLGRYDEIILFLDSMVNQSYKNFELIIVDQNENDKIEKLCSSYNMDIKVIKSDIKGLSINRNIGLRHISGDIVAFPDDDCEYDYNTLERVKDFFTQNPVYNFYICNTKEKYSELSILPNTLGDTVISPNNVMRVGCSITIFVRVGAIANFSFDEQLGVGTEFGSGEESDLLFFLLNKKNKGFFHSQHYIFHPFKEETAQKAFQYGKGYGALHKKVIVVYGFYRLFFNFLLTLIKETIKICFYPYSAERVLTMRGRIFGFCRYKPNRYGSKKQT
jgi:glycosyltransferase involved in cell wall biosynthesis